MSQSEKAAYYGALKEAGVKFGKPYRFGLEAGSKPELLAVIALADNETPIICNGLRMPSSSRRPCWRRRSAGR